MPLKLGKLSLREECTAAQALGYAAILKQLIHTNPKEK